MQPCFHNGAPRDEFEGKVFVKKGKSIYVLKVEISAAFSRLLISSFGFRNIDDNSLGQFS